MYSVVFIKVKQTKENEREKTLTIRTPSHTHTDSYMYMRTHAAVEYWNHEWHENIFETAIAAK